MNIRLLHNIFVGIWVVIFFISLFIPELRSVFIFKMLAWLWIPLFIFSLFFIAWDNELGKLKLYVEVVSKGNIMNFLQAFLLFKLQIVSSIGLEGFWFIFGLHIVLLILVLFLVYKEFNKKDKFNSGAVIGFCFLIYFITVSFIPMALVLFGNERVGSYWAKPSFSLESKVIVYKADMDTGGSIKKTAFLKDYYYSDFKGFKPVGEPLKGVALIDVDKNVISESYPGLDMYGIEHDRYQRTDVFIMHLISINVNDKEIVFNQSPVHMGLNLCIDKTKTYWFIEIIEEH